MADLMVNSVMERMEEIRACRPSEWQDNEAVNAGLSLILASAARSHIQEGDLELAAVCVVEVDRYLDLVRSGRSV